MQRSLCICLSVLFVRLSETDDDINQFFNVFDRILARLKV